VQIRDEGFASLTTDELYALLRLRSDVFVVEQACVYADLDGRDTEPGTRHVWVERAGPAAYLRVLDDGDVLRIGRVVTRAGERGSGLAAELMRHVLSGSDGPWTLDAQEYLAEWYERLGFVRSGPAYDDEGIPHVPMRR